MHPHRWNEYSAPPAEYAGQFGAYPSPLKFYDGHPVSALVDWDARRAEILKYWHGVMGPWPELLARPGLEILETSRRYGITQHKVMIEVARGVTQQGFLLIPPGDTPRPAVFVPYYNPEPSIDQQSLNESADPKAAKTRGPNVRDFAWQLARRGFVTLAIGAPGGDARKPALHGAQCQPLSYLAYIAANCHTVLAQRPEVDPRRIGVIGHSYGGKWAMFASCLYEKFACAVWSDPGVVFDERDRRKENPSGSVNYFDVWYLGFEPGNVKAGLFRKLPSEGQPRTGAYKALLEGGHDLTELHALMAPRPFLVSGGTADLPERWPALNHAIAVSRQLGQTNRVAMTNRETHSPTPESNEQAYRFFEHFLRLVPRR